MPDFVVKMIVNSKRPTKEALKKKSGLYGNGEIYMTSKEFATECTLQFEIK